jgi:hypothetical protein
MIERSDVRKAVAKVVAALAQREADTAIIDR